MLDEAVLSPFWKWLARTGAPIAAILIPAAFFLSVASPTATQPNGLMNLAYLGALFLAAAVLSLGVGPHSRRTAHGNDSGGQQNGCANGNGAESRSQRLSGGGADSPGWIRTGLALMGFGFVVARFGLFLQQLPGPRSAQLGHGLRIIAVVRHRTDRSWSRS